MVTIIVRLVILFCLPVYFSGTVYMGVCLVI